MLRRETMRALGEAGTVMALLALMPVVHAVDHEALQTGTGLVEYMTGGFAILWLIAAGVSSWRMFSAERSDGAEEYLLGLPVSPARILFAKSLPRLGVLLVLYLVGTTAAKGGLWFYDTAGLLVFLGFILVSGFLLGTMGGGRWASRLMVLAMGASVFVLAATPARFFQPLPLFATSDPLKLLPPSVVLLMLVLWAMRSWDLRPVAQREREFTKLALVPMAVLAWPAATALAG